MTGDEPLAASRSLFLSAVRSCSTPSYRRATHPNRDPAQKRCLIDPLLINLPDQIETERLILRPPRAGDGQVVFEAVLETLESLQLWMAWSHPTPTLDTIELWCRKSQSEFITRTRLPLLLFRKAGGAFVGSSGMHNIDWAIPRFEIGYWVRRSTEGQGLISEAVAGMTGFLFAQLDAKRVEVRMDDTNQRSWRVPERLGFRLEGTLQHDTRSPAGQLRSTRVYAKTSPS